jgi:hypothetical protein
MKQERPAMLAVALVLLAAWAVYVRGGVQQQAAPRNIVYNHQQAENWDQVMVMGAQGWELVAVVESSNPENRRRTYYLKKAN